MKYWVCMLSVCCLGWSQLSAGILIPGNDTIYTPDAENKNLIFMEVKDSLGQILAVGQLLNGKKEGVYRTYNGITIMTVQEFHADIPDGISLHFGMQGALELEENYRNGELDGRRVKYRFGGIKKSEENFNKGKLDGLKISYYDNGYKQEESMYKNGLREGNSKWYNEAEQLSIEYNYKNGKLEGNAMTYYPNSKIEQSGIYKNDLEEGEWKYFNMNGKLTKTVNYKAGKVLNEKIY